MYQFYALSVFCNLLAGIALSYDEIEKRFSLNKIFNPEFFSRSGFKLIFGIVTAVVGVFKFLSVTDDDVKVVGDLIPAVTGIVLGFTLLLEYYKEKATVSSDRIAALERIFIGNRTILGIAGIVVAILHFLFHAVLLL